MKLAILFAGQGAQHAGMGKDLYESEPLFRQVMDQADEAVDFDLKTLCFEGPEETLSQTQFTQPCMVAFAAGLTAVLREKGIHAWVDYWGTDCNHDWPWWEVMLRYFLPKMV